MAMLGHCFFTASMVSKFVNRILSLADPTQNIDCKIPADMERMKFVSEFIVSNASRFVIFDCTKPGVSKNVFQDPETKLIHVAYFMVCALNLFLKVGEHASPQDYFERVYAVTVYAQETSVPK